MKWKNRNGMEWNGDEEIEDGVKGSEIGLFALGIIYNYLESKEVNLA